MSMEYAPAWSMPGRQSIKRLNEVPGPGSYSPKDQPDSPNYKIGTSSRYNLTKPNSISPGPGAYNPLLDTSLNRSQKFSKSARKFLVSNNIAPGPGAYENKNIIGEGPRFSMLGRLVRSASNQSLPGPGQYNLNTYEKFIPRAPEYSMGSSKRGEKLSKSNGSIPGPGTYDNKNSAIDGPRWKFGNETRSHNAKSMNPGPGTYNFGSSLDSKGFSISGRAEESKERSVTPGPGAYDIKVGAESPQYSVGKSNRGVNSNTLKKFIPGPGAYNPAYTEPSFASVFGSSKRKALSTTLNNPGPGAYSLSNQPDGPVYTIKGKYQSKKSDFLPGPGQYNPQKRDKSPSYSVSRANRSHASHSKNEVPGPGTYNSSNTDRVPGWGFGSDRWKKRSFLASPGPGYYDIRTTIGQLPSYALSKR
ncbi:unnamed protein product [Blepharisma stoltei]|uniref:Uncharacterized protein n=1 Tax=Blepharisma stoltei TaxID=1481888 RepID=A0AAU9IS58_9CILI|nr:unnamed protein product [Blepharisma stoltei]